MNRNVQKFIQDYIDIIDSEDFDRLYDLTLGVLPIPNINIGRLTEVLIQAGINPLEHMSKVPEYYSAETDLDFPILPPNIKAIGAFAFFNCDIENVVIPSHVTRVETSAFDFCTSLESVVFEEGTESIGGNCFADCASLTEVVLPKSIKRLSGSIFRRCTNLTTLVYRGTKEEWDEIDYYPNTFNESSIKQLICSDGVFEI